MIVQELKNQEVPVWIVKVCSVMEQEVIVQEVVHHSGSRVLLVVLDLLSKLTNNTVRPGQDNKMNS